MVRQSEAERVEEWLKEATAAGAKLVAGGERKGSMITPAILTATKAGMKVRDEEIFGPCCSSSHMTTSRMRWRR